MIAIPMYFQKTGASVGFGVFYMLLTGFSIFWSTYAGTLVDRLNRRNIFLTINLICGVVVAGVALWGWLSPDQLALTAMAVFGATFLNYNIHYPTVYAFMQEISEPTHYHRIASMLEIQGQLASMLAGAGAAFLLEGADWGWLRIPRWDLWLIFAVNACTYFVAFALIATIRFVPIAERQPETGTVWQRLQTGYQYLHQNPYIFLFGVASFAVFVTIMVHNFFLAPIYIEHHLHTTGDVFAWAEMFFALGAIFAGAAIQRIFARVSAIRAALILTVVGVGIYTTMILLPVTGVFLGLSFLLGWANAGIRVLRMSYLFHVVPNQVAGRAGSIFHVFNTLLRMLFLALFALPVFHNTGVVYSMIAFAVFLLIAAVLIGVSAKKMEQ